VIGDLLRMQIRQLAPLSLLRLKNLGTQPGRLPVELVDLPLERGPALFVVRHCNSLKRVAPRFREPFLNRYDRRIHFVALPVVVRSRFALPLLG
jgi:hypothetical protein